MKEKYKKQNNKKEGVLAAHPYPTKASYLKASKAIHKTHNLTS